MAATRTHYVGALLSGLAFLVPLGPAAFADDGSPNVVSTTTPPTDQSGGPVKVPAVSVTETAPIGDGSEANGYRVDNAPNVGPWGSMPMLDAPYSVNVMPQAMIANTQTVLSDQFYMQNPFTQLFNTTDWGSPNLTYIRGFSNNGQWIDGMESFDIVNNLEDKQSAEVITGLSGFFYGPASIGGIKDFTLKRPTTTPLYDITTGYYGGAGYFHADLGGPIDSLGRLAYRLNIVAQDGDTPVQYATVKRNVISGALDWHITDALLLQLDGEQTWYHTNGTGVGWVFPGAVPSALNEAKQWGQKWAYYDADAFRGSARLIWNINNALTFRTAFSGDTETTDQLGAANYVNPGNLTYTQYMERFGPEDFTTKNFYAFLDAKFDTGFLSHKVVIGSSWWEFTGYRAPDSFNYVTIGTCTFGTACPFVPPMSVVTNTMPVVEFTNQQYLNNIVGDEIHITNWLSMLAGVNWTQTVTSDFNPSTGAESSGYHAGNISPSASLIFKPLPNISTYVTYMQGLEQGSIASDTFNALPVTNAGAASAPTIDHEYEVGAKAQVGNALLTAALFDITRSSDVYVLNGGGLSYTFLPNGLEEHKGVEVSISGKVTPDLTLWGGATWFSAKITQEPNDPAVVGKVPVDVARAMAKIYGEYAIRWLPGFALTGGVYWTGSQFVDNANTIKLPAFVTADIGARYNAVIYNRPTTFRFNVTNLAGADYWIQPGELGVPRTFILTADMKF